MDDRQPAALVEHPLSARIVVLRGGARVEDAHHGYTRLAHTTPVPTGDPDVRRSAASMSTWLAVSTGTPSRSRRTGSRGTVGRLVQARNTTSASGVRARSARST